MHYPSTLQACWASRLFLCLVHLCCSVDSVPWVGHDVVPLVAMAICGPYRPAVGRTCAGAQSHHQDLQTCPPLGDQRSGADAGASGKGGARGAAEGQLKVLPRSGQQVRQQTTEVKSEQPNIFKTCLNHDGKTTNTVYVMMMLVLRR